MIRYDYRCEKCACVWEMEAQRPSDLPTVIPCRFCGHEDARRQLSAGAGVIFRGTGFHVTDYPRQPLPPTAESEK